MARIKRETRNVPQSADELNAWLTELGETERQLGRIQIQLNDRVELAQQAAALRATPLTARKQELVEGIAIFAESHRAELLGGGGNKTVKLPAGVLQWRLTPFKVVPRRGKVQEIIAYLRANGLDRFVRDRPEIDKLAMLKEQEVAGQIPGINISRTEELIIRPLDLEVEVMAASKKVAA